MGEWMNLWINGEYGHSIPVLLENVHVVIEINLSLAVLVMNDGSPELYDEGIILLLIIPVTIIYQYNSK